MHKRRFFDGRAMFCLFDRRPFRLPHRFDFHWPPTFCRTIERFDNTPVRNSLRPRGFWSLVVKNTAGEILQLVCIVISLAKGLLPAFAIDRSIELDRINVVVGLSES